MSQPRLSVSGLSKAFPRRSASRKKGVSTEGPEALWHLLTQMMRPGRPRLQRRSLWALDNVTFDVAPGEVLGIIGRNGAGKSTLLKILGRVLHPTGGRVMIRGRVVSMLELGVGLAPELSVRQNIEIQGRLAGVSAARIRDAEEGILDFSGLTRYVDYPLGSCPSGTATQLAFAAVSGFGADVVLADEVLAVGDSAFRRACEERVRAGGKAGESVLFVSHDMAAIRRICTRVIWIDHGRIRQIGPTEEVVDAYTTELLAGRLLPPLTRTGLDASCDLIDVRLLDDERSPVGALQLTEPGYVDCLLRILRPDVSVVVEIDVTCQKCCVFSVASRPITSPAAATFRAGIRIPADFLNERTYRAVFRLRVTGVADGKETQTVVAWQALTFTAMNPHPERSVWSDWTWRRPGLVSPRLAWDLRHAAASGSADTGGSFGSAPSVGVQRGPM